MTSGRESAYQRTLIRTIESRFPGCIILKNDSAYRPGIPDLLILHRDKWVALEVKRSSRASKRPLQDHYISTMRNMSYASFISPDNEDEVLHEIQQVFQPGGAARIS